MNARKLIIALFAAGLFAVGFGASVFPASAEPRLVTVTLLGGQTMTVTVDVPPGTPINQIHIPGVDVPIIGISDAQPTVPGPTTQLPAPATTTAPTTTTTPPGGNTTTTDPATTTTAPTTTPATATTAPAPQDGAAPTATQQREQRTTGHRKSHGQVDGQEKPGSSDGSANDGTAGREPDGQPTPANPTFSEALPGPAPIGVPNFFIEKFRIPPFLLPIYQAAGIQYGVRWEVLAAINEIETDYGRNLNVSTAGAVGWMQFLPSTWERWGVDANGDQEKDPYNPVDAIFAAARYLKAAGADQDLRQAIFAYNHADWYVDSVLLRARLLGGLPADLVGSLTGLTQGHFPVHATARYADDLSEQVAKTRVKRGQSASIPVNGDASRRGIRVYAKAGSPVVAVQDGKIVNVGRTARLGRFIMLQDAYGNTYTYGHLKKLVRTYPVPKERTVSKAAVNRELHLPAADPKPTAPASAGTQPAKTSKPSTRRTGRGAARRAQARATPRKQRLFAHPSRPAAMAAGGRDQLLNAGAELPGSMTFKSYFTEVFGLKRSEVVLKPLKVGSKVIAGTILGRIGRTDPEVAPHVLFEIRPAGRGAPRVDPKPILDGWKLLESTAVYRAVGKNPFFGPDASNPSIGQILLMSKETLQRRVLDDARVQIYSCGRRDIQAGRVDRRVLATLEFLSASGLKPTVSTLECGHSLYTVSGNISEHSSGNAVDIAAINGIPIQGHQGPGSITDITIRRLLTLQGALKPHQIISLMQFDGTDNTLAMADHGDHIHVGFQPLYGANTKLARQLSSVLEPGQWIKLIDRLDAIPNPEVHTKPSQYSITVKPSAKGKGVTVPAGD
jgi:hypothetical protein